MGSELFFSSFEALEKVKFGPLWTMGVTVFIGTYRIFHSKCTLLANLRSHGETVTKDHELVR